MKTIWKFEPHEDAEENAVALGKYYLGYTMVLLAIVAADSESEARQLLIKQTDEDVYAYPDVMVAEKIGVTDKESGVIAHSCGTG